MVDVRAVDLRKEGGVAAVVGPIGVEHAVEAGSVLSDLRSVQGISTLRGVRIFNRYDVEGLTDAEFASAVRNVLSEPQLDNTYEHLPPRTKGERTLAVEYLPCLLYTSIPWET